MNVIKVIKRDGSIQLWDFGKIINAVNKAFTAVNKSVTEEFITKLRNEFTPFLEAGNDLTVEDIKRLEDNINNIPRDILGGDTPYNLTKEKFPTLIEKLESNYIAPDDVSLNKKDIIFH